MAWTNEMVDRLSELWLSGLTTNEIAKELGMSKNSVVGKVHRLNLISRPSPIKKKEEEEKLIIPSKPTNKKEIFNKQVKEDFPFEEFDKEPIKPLPEKKVHSNGCIKLSELNSHTCRWPIGDPKDDNFCFCGKKVRAGQTYCDEHSAIAYVKPIRK